MKRVFVTYLFIVIFLEISGQTPFIIQHLFPQEYKHVKVLEFFEQEDGFMWIGTNHGLFQYDGLNFKKIKLGPDSIVTTVTSIYEDRSKRMWVGTGSGAIYSALEDESFHLWEIEEGFPSVKITGFAETNDSILWIASYGEGLYYYKTNRLYNIDLEDGLSSLDIYQIISTNDENNWLVAGTDNGINRCRIYKDKKEITSITPEMGLPDLLVSDIIADKNGNLWAGFYDNGYCQIDINDNIVSKVPTHWPYGVVNSLEIFNNNELWIATQENGIYRYDLASDQLYANPFEQLIGKKIHLIKKDVEGNIWICAQNNEIYSANRKFEVFGETPENIQSIWTDNSDVLWLGTNDGLFFKKKHPNYSESTVEIKLLAGENILSLFQDEFGTFWVGTFGNGIILYNPKSNKLRRFNEKNQLPNGSILSMGKTKDFIWLATLGGVVRIDKNDYLEKESNLSFKTYEMESGIGTNFIYDIFVDSEEKVWFATDGEGLFYWEVGENIQQISKKGELPFKSIYSITEDDFGNIWFSTAKNGIFKYDGNKLTQLALKEGIRDLAITGLIKDKNGEILITHQAGIDILDPLTHHLIYYDNEVGLDKIEPNINAVFKDNYGNIWIGTRSKLIRYTAMEENFSIHPRTKFTEVSVNLNPIPFNSYNCLASDENNLVFEYVGIWYTDPKTVEYRYRLKGYNEEWIVSRDQKAVYTNLPSGDYTFQVTSTENDAFEHEPILAYSFTIHKPLWMRGWFIVSMMTVFGFLIHRLLRYRDSKIEKEESYKAEKITSQLEVLKSQINPHFLFNSFNTLLSLIDEDPATASKFTEKLSDFYRSILQYREKDLIPIQEEIELVNNYYYLLRNRYQESFQLHYKGNGKELFSYIPPMTMQILIENAIKHNVISSRNPLHVTIDFSDKDWIEVSNNYQPKINTESSTGFGLESIKKRYSILTKKELIIHSDSEKFEVKLPKLLKDFN